MDCESIAQAVGSGFSLGSALSSSFSFGFCRFFHLYLAKPPLLFSSPHYNYPASHDALFLLTDLHDSIHDRSDRQSQWTSTLFRYCHTSQRTINWMFYRLVRLSKLRHAIDTLFPSAIIFWLAFFYFFFVFSPCYLCICTSVWFSFFSNCCYYMYHALYLDPSQVTIVFICQYQYLSILVFERNIMI